MEQAAPIARIVVLQTSPEGTATPDALGALECQLGSDAGSDEGDALLVSPSSSPSAPFGESSRNTGEVPIRTTDSRDPVSILRRLGGDVELEVVLDSASCLLALDEAEPDLVVLDCPIDLGAQHVIEALQAEGPPVVVITRETSDEAALDAFRQGASDCVRIGGDDSNLLAGVALEQIRRWRRRKERGEAEQRIRWLERLNNAIVSEITAGLAVLDADGAVVTINPECARLLGASAKNAIGSSLESVFRADLVKSAGLVKLVEDVASGLDAAPRLGRFVDEEGQTRIVDVRSQRIADEAHVLLVLSDITEEEHQARRIGELQLYNENIIQNMNSALVVVGEGGDINFANPTAENILGVAAGELVGRCIDDWFAPERPERNLVARTLADGTRFKGAETLISFADGKVVPIGISCSPLLDQDDKRLGAVAIFQDLSEIKQLERQVLQSEKMASIGQLAAGIAHEINNPMGFIHANLFQMVEYLDDLQRVWNKVSEMQSQLAGGASLEEVGKTSRALDQISQEIDFDFIKSDFAKAVRESQEGSERIRHIVRDLRDFSHHDTVEALKADLNQCLDSTANIVWTMMKHSVVLKKDYCELPPLRCFPMQLKQVFMNLLVNAYQAIEDVATEPGVVPEIEVKTQLQGDSIVVSIRDAGVGIAAEDLKRIFDPFFTTKEVGAGTGLGLSTSYNIVKRHGGEIRVDSEIGKGTVFEVRLPIAGVDEVQSGV